jgi:hypothetical protein
MRTILKRLGKGTSAAEIEKQIQDFSCRTLMLGDRVAGCVKRAHESDVSINRPYYDRKI